MRTRSLRAAGLILTSLMITATSPRVACAQRDGAELPNEAAVREAQLFLELEFQTERVDRRQRRTELREQFESALRSRLEKLDRRYGLSESQRKKLMLAGQVEIRRYVERTEELERKLSLVRRNPDEFAKVHEEMNELDQVRGQRLFEEGTFFAKILASTLTKEQSARYQAIEKRVSAERHQAALKWVLSTWDESLGLSAAQHSRLEAVLARATRPPRRFGEDDYFAVLWQVSRLPEPQLKTIFRADQWAKLTPQIERARQMEAVLRQKGYLPDDDVAVRPTSVEPPAADSEKKRG